MLAPNRTTRSTIAAPWNDERLLRWDKLRAILSRPLDLAGPVEVHLMRHGETETNARSLVTGAQDVALTSAGLEQARVAGLHLDTCYDVAFHSGLSRSRLTLLNAVEAGGVSIGAVYPDRRLNERSLGVLELHPSLPIEGFAKGDLYYAPPGGDSYIEVARRLLNFLIDLGQLNRVAGFRKVLICGHMGPMRLLVGIFEGCTDPAAVLARSFKNTEILKIEWRLLSMPSFLPSTLGTS